MRSGDIARRTGGPAPAEQATAVLGDFPARATSSGVHLVDDTPAHPPLPLDVMRSRLEAAGIHPEQIEIVYCQIGIRASLGAFVLRMLGNDRARMYDASTAEWANRDDTPLVL